MAQPYQPPRSIHTLHRRVHIIWLCLLVLTLLDAVYVVATDRMGVAATNSSMSNISGLMPMQCIARFPQDLLIGQTLMVGIKAGDLATEATLFKQYDIGGAAIMTAPANPADDSIATFKHTASSYGIPVLTGTDEEGGSVQRFTGLGILPSPKEIVLSSTPETAKRLIAAHAARLHSAGIDVVFGPLADVAPDTGTSPLGDRIFSADPTTVRTYDLAYIAGWQSAGLLPTLKHFPGLGSASANTDYQSAITPLLAQLQHRDFLPYAPEVAETGTAVMIGNQVVPQWSDGPASLSPTVITYLRNTLGFRTNLLITDSLDATAISQSMTEGEAAVRALDAGDNIALFVREDTTYISNKDLIVQVKAAIRQALAAGTLKKSQLIQSVGRKLSAQHIDPCSISNLP